MLYSGTIRCYTAVRTRLGNIKFAFVGINPTGKEAEMGGCLRFTVLLVLACIVLSMLPTIVAVLTIVGVWLMVTVGLIAPTWITSYLLERFEERFAVSLVHAFLYGLWGVFVTALLAFDQLTAKNGAVGSVDIGLCLFWVWFFGSAGCVATEIVFKIKPLLGRTGQSVIAIIATIVFIGACGYAAANKALTWRACQEQTQWLTDGVDFKAAEVSLGGKVIFLFQNRLSSPVEIRTNIGHYSRRSEPFICQPGECRVDLTNLETGDLDSRWQINISTDRLSVASGLFGMYPYAVVFGKRRGESTIIQVVDGYCDFLTLQEKYVYKEVGTVKRK